MENFHSDFVHFHISPNVLCRSGESLFIVFEVESDEVADLSSVTTSHRLIVVEEN